jgi:peroxiredoxin
MIQEGTRIPDAKLRRLTARGIEEVSTLGLFAGRRAILFGVPGAFTPTCTNEHLPGYVRRAADLRAAGIETIACVAVNDPYVMDAWGRSQGAGDAILMLSDGNGELTRALGLEADLTAIGLGIRCRRFAAWLEDGWFRAVAVEPARGVTVCGAEHLLDRIARSATAI